MYQKYLDITIHPTKLKLRRFLGTKFKREKLYDTENYKDLEQILPCREQKSGKMLGVFVLINLEDSDPIKSYPYINEDGEIVFEKQGDKVWGVPCDAISPKYAFDNASVNHFDNL